MIEICSACFAPRPCRCQRSIQGAKPKAVKRWRSSPYLAFVRTLPCCIPGCQNWRQAEPHHAGQRGVGEKVDDFLCIPLCREHHEESHSQGQGWPWASEVPYFQLQTIAAAIAIGVMKAGDLK